MKTALLCQIGLLAYHQATTYLDLFPFNGAKNYSRHERLAEMGINALLMGLAPLGFAFNIRALQVYGVVYYFILFLIELVIWWVPYFILPKGGLRGVYKAALAVATSDFRRCARALDRHLRAPACWNGHDPAAATGAHRAQSGTHDPSRLDSGDRPGHAEGGPRLRLVVDQIRGDGALRPCDVESGRVDWWVASRGRGLPEKLRGSTQERS
jgi:hypothetical protein